MLEFRAAGVTVTPGPKTNAVIPCSDGAHLELVSYGSSTLGSAIRLLAKTPGLQPLLGGGKSPAERRIADGLANSTGLIALVLRVDDLDERLAALRANGFTADDPTELPPDGTDAPTRIATPDDPTLPLLIEAGGTRRTEATGPGITRLTIISDDRGRTGRGLQILLGEPSDGEWQLGQTAISVDEGPVDSRLPRLRARLTGPLPPTAYSMGLSNLATDPGDAVVERLARALRMETVSYEDPADCVDDPFVELGEHLEESFPLVHATLKLQKFGHSRLYTWPGAESDRAAGLFLAHMDVVPVDDRARWTHPPFAGVVDDEFIWGRGAIDDKSRVLAWLEAVELALADGVTPRGTVYFAFGHDEEIGGENGAEQIAEHFRRNGIRPDFLLDEGGVVTRGVVDGVDRPVASIMLGEKGFATVALSTDDIGGHSSMPPKQTAVGRIARAVAALQDTPMPLRMTPVVLDMTKRLAPFMTEPRRTLLGSADRLGAVITRILTSRPQTEALVRTTTAPTVIRGGVKANVLPQHAEALVNFRILQGDTVDGVLAHCRDVIADDRVTVELAPGMRAEPSPLTSSDDPAFALVAEIVRDLIPDVAITTGLVPGATDARHYNDVAKARINFAPIIVDQADLERIHGANERISRENYGRLIRFDRHLIDRI